MQVINAGISSKMAADNMTGCLPDVWQFCGLTSAGANTNLMCPSVSYRRPVQAMTNKLSQVGHAERLCETPIMFTRTPGTVQQGHVQLGLCDFSQDRSSMLLGSLISHC